MGGYIKRDVKRVEVSPLNTKVNKEVFDNFKDACKRRGYPMNVMLEIFMWQYANGRFHIDADDILKFKNDDSEMDTLNTTFSKDIYNEFKAACRNNKDGKFFVKHVVTAFMEKFASGCLVPEFVEVTEVVKSDTRG